MSQVTRRFTSPRQPTIVERATDAKKSRAQISRLTCVVPDMILRRWPKPLILRRGEAVCRRCLSFASPLRIAMMITVQAPSR